MEFAKITTIYSLLYWSVVAFATMSILVLYRRIFASRRLFTVTSNVLLCLVFIWWVSGTIGEGVGFRPIEAYWDTAVSGQYYLNYNGFWLTNMVSELVIETVILLMPVREVIGLQLEKRKKVLVVGMFCMGAFVLATGIVRIHYVWAESMCFSLPHPFRNFLYPGTDRLPNRRHDPRRDLALGPLFNGRHIRLPSDVQSPTRPDTRAPAPRRQKDALRPEPSLPTHRRRPFDAAQPAERAAHLPGLAQAAAEQRGRHPPRAPAVHPHPQRERQQGLRLGVALLSLRRCPEHPERQRQGAGRGGGREGRWRQQCSRKRPNQEDQRPVARARRAGLGTGDRSWAWA